MPPATTVAAGRWRRSAIERSGCECPAPDAPSKQQQLGNADEHAMATINPRITRRRSRRQVALMLARIAGVAGSPPRHAARPRADNNGTAASCARRRCATVPAVFGHGRGREIGADRNGRRNAECGDQQRRHRATRLPTPVSPTISPRLCRTCKHAEFGRRDPPGNGIAVALA